MSKKLWFSLILISLMFTAPVNVIAAEDGAVATQKPALHRADFRIEGASCVQCLRRIAATFRKDAGVKKADVSVFRPYWSIVIYDANQTNWKNLSATICKTEKVRLAEFEDKSIDAIPSIIIPKGIGTQANVENKPATPPATSNTPAAVKPTAAH